MVSPPGPDTEEACYAAVCPYEARCKHMGLQPSPCTRNLHEGHLECSCLQGSCVPQPSSRGEAERDSAQLDYSAVEVPPSHGGRVQGDTSSESGDRDERAADRYIPQQEACRLRGSPRGSREGTAASQHLHQAPGTAPETAWAPPEAADAKHRRRGREGAVEAGLAARRWRRRGHATGLEGPVGSRPRCGEGPAAGSKARAS